MKRFLIIFLISIFLVGCNSQPPPENIDDDIQDVMTKAKTIVETALSTDSSIPELLNAIAVAQQVGLGKDVEQKLLDKINIKLKMQLADPGLCKKKLLEILTLAQQLGFEDLENIITPRLNTALDSCDGKSVSSTVKSEYTFQTDEKLQKEIGTTKVKITASVIGNLKEYTIGGFSAEGQDSFFFENGQLTWSLDDYSENGCEIKTRKGSGTKQLTSPNHGSFTLFADGTYNGYIVDIEVPITASTKMKSAELIDTDGDPETPLVNPCNDVKEESHSETQNIEVYMDSKTEDMTHIIDGYQKTQEDNVDEMGITINNAVWDLSLPK